MDVTLLFPHSTHPAIEERYASWQSELLARRDAPGVVWRHFDSRSKASALLKGISTTWLFVITDPLIVPSPHLVSGLLSILESHPDAVAALPVMNESDDPRQQVPPPVPYLTLRQFQETATQIGSTVTGALEVIWGDADPGAYLVRTASLTGLHEPARSALSGLPVVLASNLYVHRYSSHRGQTRHDILERISTSARSVLEFGCGEGGLGAALKARQQCRVVGIELDEVAGKLARKRLDEVLSGDVRTIVDVMREQFDWIVGGDILEHLDEPWTFLAQLKRISKPGGKLILSLPNVSSWPIVSDLLRGRFDYVYMGITCAGHLRFFTRQTISDMLTIAGWSVESITAQDEFRTPEGDAFFAALEASGIQHSREDLSSPGYYVIGVNEG